MINGTKWIGSLTRLGRTVYSMINQIRHVPARIVCEMPDGRHAIILAGDGEYRIQIIDERGRHYD